MTLIQLYFVLFCLLVLGFSSIVIGSRQTAFRAVRMTIPLGFLYACIFAILCGFYGVTTTFDESASIFRWSFSPLLPALGVYGGILMFAVLVIAFAVDVRRPGVPKWRAVASAVLGYGSAMVAVFLALRLPIAAQEALDILISK